MDNIDLTSEETIGPYFETAERYLLLVGYLRDRAAERDEAHRDDPTLRKVEAVMNAMRGSHLERVEEVLDSMEAQLPTLRRFVRQALAQFVPLNFEILYHTPDL